MRQLLFVMGLCALSTSAWAQESPLDACPKFERVPVPPADLPTPAERQAFTSAPRACSDYLHGFGVKQDRVQARKCCLAKDACFSELAMIYANGWGVKRNYDLAARFICAAEEVAPAEASGMLEHLQEMRASTAPAELDYCEHVTSGMGAAHCEHLEEQRQTRKNEARLAALEKGWDAATRKGFAALRQAAGKFFEGEASLRSDESRGGTIQSSEYVISRRQLHAQFIEAVERANTPPPLSATDEALKQADAELNATYRAKLAAGDKMAQQLLKTAQRAWIPYRDAWVRFQQARWGASVDAKKLSTEVLTRLTRERTEALKALTPINAEE
jgi:uncharacterized protein YecT (DUF1311 family)